MTRRNSMRGSGTSTESKWSDTREVASQVRSQVNKLSEFGSQSKKVLGGGSRLAVSKRPPWP